MQNIGQSLIVGTTTYPTFDIQIISNYFAWNTPYLGYGARSNANLTYVGNFSVEPETLSFVHQISGVASNNTVFFDQSLWPGNYVFSFTANEITQSNLQFTIDYNTYYALKIRSHICGVFQQQT